MAKLAEAQARGAGECQRRPPALGRAGSDEASHRLGLEARWLPMDAERWQAHLGCDEDLDEPAELFFYCSTRAEREFGDGLCA